MFYTPTHPIIQTILASFLMLFVVNCFAESTMKIFTQPPPPNELADTLFPKRFRTVVINNDAEIPTNQLQNNSNSTLSYQQSNQQSDEQGNMFGLLINFEYDSTNIVTPSLPLLDSVGEMLKLEQTAGQAIVIEGHADATGSFDYNQALSERRARAIRRYLVSIFDIEPDRLVIIGKGEQELHNPQDPTNSINRRVVFKPLNRS